MAIYNLLSVNIDDLSSMTIDLVTKNNMIILYTLVLLRSRHVESTYIIEQGWNLVNGLPTSGLT